LWQIPNKKYFDTLRVKEVGEFLEALGRGHLGKRIRPFANPNRFYFAVVSVLQSQRRVIKLRDAPFTDRDQIVRDRLKQINIG
jgi:hypothetical protein